MSKKAIYRLRNIAAGSVIAMMAIIAMILLLQFTNDLLFGAKTIEARTNSDFKEKQKQVRLMFAGASDMKAAMIPAEFDGPAFNYAMHNEFYIGTYYKLKECMDDMPALEMVILPVSMGSFLSYWALRTDVPSFEFIDREDFLELFQNQGVVSVFQKMRRFCYVMNPSRFKEFLGNLGNLILMQPVSKASLVDGYRVNDGTMIDSEKAAVKARLYFSRTEPFDQTMLLYFSKILELCHRKGVAVVTVTLPKSNSYADRAEKYVTMDQVTVRVLGHPDYKPYIRKHYNYLDLFSDRQDLFSDANHLNYQGAQRLSKIMASELKKMK